MHLLPTKVGWPCQDFTQGSNREQPKRLMREMITAWAWINYQTNQAGENSLFLMHWGRFITRANCQILDCSHY